MRKPVAHINPPTADAQRLSFQPSERELFARLHETGDQHARELLVERLMPLARRLARRYANSSETLEDIVQVANLGLVKAIDRFDPELGKPFGAFAVPTILGEIRRHLRDCTWSVHVTRSAQERSMATRQAIEVLQSETGHMPSVQELAQYMEVDQEQVLDALCVMQARHSTSLDAPLEEDSEATPRLERLGGDDAGYEQVERRLAAAPALECLEERDRRILTMGYIGEMSQAEIGAEIGVSQMQVSRLMRRALARAQAVVDAD
ncbi:MAG TPA: SigB/SigF/SigG family RNA polymerase sigma factor [Solirubrobacteraceae bacterium]